MVKEVVYRSFKALKPVKGVISEAEAALEDEKRTKSADERMNQALIAASAGGVVSLTGLYFGGVTGFSAVGLSSGAAAAGGLIGGGVATGVAVLATPVMALGAGGYYLANKRRKTKLREQKEMLLQEAMIKQQQIIEELKRKVQQTEERAEYLCEINKLLQSAIQELQNDLEVAA